MQVTEVPRSPAAILRRRQIIDAAIVTIADRGYEHASFVEIARQAELSSTRLISYHFDNRADLMTEVAAHVVGELRAAVGAEVETAETPLAAIRAYIHANVEYMSAHRKNMAAVTSLLFAGALHVSPQHRSPGTDALKAIIDAGRRSGEFGAVDPAVAATIIQRAIEGIPLLLRQDPTCDLSRQGAEMERFFDSALAPPADPQGRR